MAQSGFPRYLLEGTASEKLAYFKGYTIAHPKLKSIDETLIQTIREPAGATLILVYGPTGVGKTTLRLHVEKRLTELAAERIKINPDVSPYVSIEAVALESGYYDWKDYYRRALLALKSPLIGSGGERIENLRLSTAELRYFLELTLRTRKPSACFIDEAQHLARMSSGRRIQDQLDAIKSIASITNVVHVLIGTYELLAFRNLSGQLSRRSIDIHFPRYQSESEEDMAIFKNILWTFQRHIPIKEEPNLLQNWWFFYERSVGCVGILKDWLVRALASALEKGMETLTFKHLEQHALSVSQCIKIATEAMEGELAATDTQVERQRLQKMLDIKPQSVDLSSPLVQTKQSTSESYTDETAEELINRLRNNNRRNRPIAKRKPKRDKVG